MGVGPIIEGSCTVCCQLRQDEVCELLDPPSGCAEAGLIGLVFMDIPRLKKGRLLHLRYIRACGRTW